MIGEIRPYSGEFEDRSNAQPLQFANRANARTSENGRTGIGPSGEHHSVRFDKGSVAQPDSRSAGTLALDGGNLVSGLIERFALPRA